MSAELPALSRRNRILVLVGLAVAGVAIRLFFAVHWYGNGDIFTFDAIGQRAEQSFFHLYSTNEGFVYWPYPPGYLPWLVGAEKIVEATGWAFQWVVQLLPIAADVGIATLVYAFLGHRGSRESTRIAAFGCVMLGPVFIAISGYHGQFDQVAILPAVAALLVWETRPEGRRAIEAGILIGLGGALKTVPLLMLLPLVFSSRSVKESIQVVAVGVGVVLAISLPFIIAEPAGFRGGPVEYSGAPGRGGLSLVLDPAFAANRRLSDVLSVAGHPAGLSDWLSTASGPITALALAGLSLFLWRRRPDPALGAVLLWLTIFVFSPNFLLQYLLWALPFFLMAGFVRQTAILQVAVVPALLLTYLSAGWYGRLGADLYVVLMAGLWIAWVVALIHLVRRIVRSGDGSEPGGVRERASAPGGGAGLARGPA